MLGVFELPNTHIAMSVPCQNPSKATFATLYLRPFPHQLEGFPTDHTFSITFLWQPMHFFEVGGAGVSSGLAFTTAS